MKHFNKKKFVSRFRQSVIDTSDLKDMDDIDRSIAALIQNVQHVEKLKRAVPAIPRHTPKETTKTNFFIPSPGRR